MFGAGIWAQRINSEESIGVSVSGTGEAIMRLSFAQILAKAFLTEDLHNAIEEIFMHKLPGTFISDNQPMSAGAIILVKESDGDNSIKTRLWCVFNTKSMALAYASSEMFEPQSIVLRQPEWREEQSAPPFYLTMLPWERD